MKLKDVIDDYEVKVYTLNYSITSPDMFGTILYKGNAKLINREVLLESEIFRLFESEYTPTTIIVY